jgi:hypothetical protein
MNVTTSINVLKKSLLFTSSKGNLMFICFVAAGSASAVLLASGDRATIFYPKFLVNHSYNVTEIDVNLTADTLSLYVSDQSVVSTVDDVVYTQPVTRCTAIKKNMACYVEGILRRVFINNYNICANSGAPGSKCTGLSIKEGKKCSTCKQSGTKPTLSLSLDLADKTSHFKVSVMPGHVLDDLLESMHVHHPSNIAAEAVGCTFLLYVSVTKGSRGTLIVGFNTLGICTIISCYPYPHCIPAVIFFVDPRSHPQDWT